MKCHKSGACIPQQSTAVSPEGVGIAGVLWSTLWRCICVQLGKIHGHSSLLRLQESGLRGQDSLAEAAIVVRANMHTPTSIHTCKIKQTQAACTALLGCLSQTNELRFCHRANCISKRRFRAASKIALINSFPLLKNQLWRYSPGCWPRNYNQTVAATPVQPCHKASH